jgi:RHS repeat-associated protein
MFTPDPANTTASAAPVIYSLHTDHLDTPRVATDKNGKIRWRHIAEPFGTTAPETNPENLGQFTQNLRFPGQYFDQETGLHYNWHRDYDASIGRYVQSDPIGLKGGINTYGYVDGNPSGFIDPMGLQIATVNEVVRVVLPSVAAACSTGVGCAAVAVGAVGAVGAGSYWLTDRYVNPWAQPLITKAIDACTQSSSNEREKDCGEQLERDEAECLVTRAFWGKQGLAICLANAKERYSQCLRGK